MVYSLANVFVVMITTYYTYHILTVIFNRKQRETMQDVNDRLDDLRSKPRKTVAEQKEFINMKHPKFIGRFKWSWASLPKIILTIVIYIIIFRTYFFVFNYFNINLALWQAILYVVIFPLVLNLILEKFKVQKGDISVFFRSKRK